jgi:hypothetical protein
MEAFSYIVLILLSLVGYSAGAVRGAGRGVELKPRIVDLILLSAVWGGAVFSRMALDWNRWLVILAWIVLSGLIGVLAVWPRRPAEETALSKNRSIDVSKGPLRILWQRWGDFSGRMGSFQSRIVASLVFFVVVAPFAMAAKAFSDPLGKKYRGGGSYWLPRTRTEANLEQSRRQF